MVAHRLREGLVTNLLIGNNMFMKTATDHRGRCKAVDQERYRKQTEAIESFLQ